MSFKGANDTNLEFEEFVSFVWIANPGRFLAFSEKHNRLLSFITHIWWVI